MLFRIVLSLVLMLSTAVAQPLQSPWKPALKAPASTPVKLGLNSGVKLHTGQIATRSSTNNSLSSLGVNKFVQSKSAHMFPYGATSFQIVLIGWQGQGSDTAIGSATDATAEFEYPAGVCTTITFSGSSTGSIPSGSNLVSDAVAVTVATGGRGWMHIGLNNNTKLVWGGLQVNSSIGDAVNVSATAIAHTPCQAPTTNVGVDVNLTPPAAIIALTREPSLCIVGDSIAYGIGSTANTNGDLGFAAQAIGATYGYINQAVSSQTTVGFQAAAKRSALARSYCTAVISEIGINNFVSLGQTAAQVEAGLQLVYTQYSPLPTWQTTLTPNPTSTDNCATVGNQTVASFNTDWLAVNAYVAGTPSPLSGFFDVSNLVQSSANSGKWNAPGYTPDCLHPSQTGHAAMAAGINLSVFSPWLYP